MLTQSKKLLNAVKKLYTKVTGGKITKSNDLSTVIDSMADNYKCGGSGSSLKVAVIYFSYSGYVSNATLFIDESLGHPVTYEELFNYLKNNGFTKQNDNYGTLVKYPCAGGIQDDGDYVTADGIYVDDNNTSIVVSGVEYNAASNYYEVSNDETFSITYLGQD